MKSVSFLPSGLTMEAYTDVAPYYDLLLNFEISTEPQLQQWLRNRSELESFISENMAWRYIQMT
jgi:oligoendopeptidase F